MKSTTRAELPILRMKGKKDWERWLTCHHESSPGVWLMIAKKGSPLTSVSYAEALEAALCHGWIDGQKQAHDSDAWLQKFTPRGARSIWSKINREKAEQLLASGRMTPAGLRAIENAKRNGRWFRIQTAKKGGNPRPAVRVAVEHAALAGLRLLAADFGAAVRAAHRLNPRVMIELGGRHE